MFAKEKEKKPTGNFADKFASKLQQEKQTFKVDLFKEEQKKEKQEELNTKMTKTMNRAKNVEAEVVGQKNITKNIDLEIDAEDAKYEDLYECQGCGRKFKRDALEKHKIACKKVFQTKRREFNIEEQRMIDQEQMILAKKG